MKLSEIKRAAKEYGLAKLSEETGMARSYLYRVIDGDSSPTVDSLEKIASVLGFKVKLERVIPVDSVLEVSMKVAAGGDWKIHFFNFVDAFRRNKNSQLISSPPSKRLPVRETALLSSIVFELCRELDTEIPEWAAKSKPLKEPWFVAEVENLKAMAIIESPIGFKRNNIFVLDNFLSRA